MAKSCLHFSPIKSNSEAHNERRTKLDYNFPELEKNNENFILERVDDRTKAIQSYCKKVSGKKLQKNAVPIREGVVTLNPHHSMEDLKRLSQVLKKEKGIDCFQIHIHRDEGKSRDNINYHAHMIFDWQDKESGKIIRLNKADMSQIQTIVADILNMERGKSSDKRHLNAIQFKIEAEIENMKEIEKAYIEAHALEMQEREKEFTKAEFYLSEIIRKTEEIQRDLAEIQNQKNHQNKIISELKVLFSQIQLPT